MLARLRGRVNFLDLMAVIVALCAVGMTGLAAWKQFFAPPPAVASSRSSSLSKDPIKIDNWDHLASTGHRFGATNPKTTIVVFGDFQCPACKGFVNHELASLRRKYPDDLAIVFHHWPLSYHKYAYDAARASECAASQGRFMEFHDAIYAKQDSLGKKSFTSYAKDASVPDLRVFAACAARNDSVAAINQGIAEASELGSHGTPTIIINGYRYPFTPSEAEVDSVIRASLSVTKP